jgi:hypothetical protein
MLQPHRLVAGGGLYGVDPLQLFAAPPSETPGDAD